MRALSGLLALVLVALVTGLTPAAFATPPDPTWLSGCWDDDDFDNAVAAIAGASAIGTASGSDCGPIDDSARRVEPVPLASCPVVLCSAHQSRAPPAGVPLSA